VKNLDYLMHKELGYLELRVEKAYDCYRLWCAQIAEAPLFDQFDALASALQVYTPVLDLQCASSVLRGIEGENNEMVVRFDLERLQQAGGRNFRA
jgi:hypothetical protein